MHVKEKYLDFFLKCFKKQTLKSKFLSKKENYFGKKNGETKNKHMME